jgi:mannosyltransferase
VTITIARRPINDRRTALPRWAPVTVGAIAAGVSLIGATVPSVWYDEAATVTAATRGWDGLWAMVADVDAVHAAYYLLMHGLFELVGYSPLALRLPSALAVGATAALLVLLGDRIGGRRLGLLAGLVFAVLPRTLWMGAEGRSYAVAALLVTASTLVLLIARESPRRRWWIGYAGLAALSMVVFVYSALVLLAHAVAVLAGPRDPAGKASRRRFAIVASGALLAVAPLALVIVQQRGQVAWLPRIDGDTVQAVLVQQWFGGDRFSWPSGPIDAIAASAGWALLLVGLVDLLRRRGGAGPLVLALVVLPTAVLLAATALVLPLYSPRYLTMSLPFVALAVAAGVAALPGRRRRWVALALLVAIGAGSLAAQRDPEAKEGTAWPAVAAWIAADRADAGEAAVVYGHLRFHGRATAEVIAQAYPGAFAGMTDATLARSAADAGSLWAERTPIADSSARLDGAQRTYLIGSEVQHDLEDQALVIDQAGFTETERVRIGHVVIVRFDRG